MNTISTLIANRSRRDMLGLAARGAALAGAALAIGPQHSAHASEDEPLVGSWLVAGTATGAPASPPRLLVSFVPGGVALRSAPLQQPAPTALGSDKMFISSTHGAWSRTGETSFGLTFHGFAFNANGEYLARQRIRVAVELNDNQDGFTGDARTDYFGPDGGVLASGTATVEGTRIQVESLA